MAIDRRKSAAKRFEDDRKKKAAAAAKKAEQEKKAAAKKSQKQNKPVRSPGKDITTSVRDTFRQQAAKPQFGREQTAAQRMQGRSENWARLETQKAGADKSTRKKIEAAQDRLHKANRKDAKGMTFDSATGRWMGGGKPAYTPNVLPGMSRDAQRTGTERSLRNGIVAPDMQKAAKKHRDAVWDRVHGPETGERIKKMLSGAAKGYGSDMENFHGLAITGRGLGMEKEHAREIKVWEDEIRRWEKSLRDWEADGSLTNDERKELTDLIAANRKKIEMYEKQNRGTRAASQEVYQTADALGESGARDTQTAKRGLGAFGSAAIDVGTAGAQMLGDMALGGTPAMLMRGIGGGAKEARQSGASHMQQANYGMLSGAASVLTEKISNVAKPLGKAFGKGAADDLIQKGIDKAVKKLAGSTAGEKALQTIAKHGANALGEGFEESLEAALDPLLKRATYDSGAQWDLGEIIYNGIIGAGTGLVAGSGMEAAQNGIESAARGVRDRMEQPLPLPRAKPKGQETGTPRQDVNSPEMDAMQSAWQETDSMLGSDSMRRYMTQVDLTFQGNMREGMYLRLGDTPQILRKFGAKSDNVVMTQDTARKIAYPSGYLGVKHGHNLGIPALKQLPMQVANPEAVLRSKSQPNSLVLLTKWIDKDGAPVIIALHLDKRGQLTIDNQVASAYGKRNLDALVGENGENILWTKKEDTLYPQSTGLQLPETSGDGVPSTHSIPQADAKNKSIDQLLSNGRPMPEAMADDTLVAHSIARNSGGNKAKLTMEYGKPQAQETAIDTNPETHTPEQMAQIQEYVNSADDGLLDFAKTYEENPNAKFGRYTISPVSQRQAADISKILGIEVSGYRNAINKSGVNHILKRHGANGEADHSMAELGDLSRMGYVIDHYDTVQVLTDQNGEPVTSTEFRGADNAPAPMVRFSKKIDGTYYVVEAVADNRYKKLWVVSAYMDKSSPVTQVLDAEKTAPSSQSSETPLASPESALSQSVAQTAGESKAGLTMEYGKPKTENSQAIGQAEKPGLTIAYGKPQAGAYDSFLQPMIQLKNKLESDLKNARSMMPSEMSEKRIRELESHLDEVRTEVRQMETNRAQFTAAQETAAALGAKFEIADLGAAAGKYENGTITINPYTGNPVRQVFVHEMTHYIESSGQYDALRGHVLQYIAQDMHTDVKAMQDEIIRDYAQYGVKLDENGAQRELVAKFCEEKLFTDEKSIQRLAQTDAGLFGRIRQWISDTIRKLRGTKQENALREMERLYEKAARTVGQVQTDGGAQYSVQTLPDGRKYVKADRPVIEGDDPAQWSRQAEQFINEKIRNGEDLRVYTPDGFAIDITERSAYKLSDSHVQSIQKVGRAQLDEAALAAKMRAAGHIDELAETSKWRNWRADENGKHQNDIGEDGFDYFTSYFEDADGQYYEVRFSAGVNQGMDAQINGDIDTAYSIGVMNKRRHPSSTGSSNSPFGSGAHSRMSSDISIHQTGQNGNSQNSLGLSFGQLRDNVNGALGRRSADSSLADSDEMRVLLDAWEAKRQAERQAEESKNGLTLTRRDMEMARSAARLGVDSQRWEQADNPEQAYIYGSALRAVREADQPIREFMAQRQAELQGDAQQAAEWIASFAKDKKTGLQYQRETMERNIRDIFGGEHQEQADAIIREYITPVHQAVAEGNRLKNDYRARVKELKLNEHESALVQMLLENENGAVSEYLANNNIRVTPEMEAKLQKAVEEFRAIYNELYTQINAALIRNGQQPAPFRKNYAPHFRKDKPDTMLGKIRFALGLGKDSSLNLPTDLAGITDEFRPGKKWFGNLLRREGEITDFDAVAGFDGYIETAADLITLTDSIQKLRALEDATRYTLSDEGVKAQIDAIRANDELDALAQRQKMEELYGNNPTTAQQLIQDLKDQKQMGMGRFVTELRRYTDNLAGKKSREDRAIEDMLNRQIYTVAKNLEGRTAANMIALNPGSWLTNLIPITQASGEVSTGNLLAGMKDTVKAFVKDDGFADASDFLTNRAGSDRLDKTLTQRASDFAGKGMELADRIASQTIVRARTRQNMQQGMSFEDAVADADSFAAGLMADRSKGAQPTIFNATNPLVKTVTMFQIEVNNQLSYLFKDMPKAQAQKSAAAVAWAFTKVFVGAHLYNLVYREITGRDAALDPIGWIKEAFGIGEDDEEERTGFEVAESLGKNVAENLPFVGGLLGGGRVPISSALPNPSIIWGAMASDAPREKKNQQIGKELLKPAVYLLPPFGGGAVKRAAEGAQAVHQGGVYGMDDEGNRTLKFPVYGQKPGDYARAMLFGRYSLPTGREYIDSGFKGGLNAKENRAFEKLRGTDEKSAKTVYEAIRELKNIQPKKDKVGNTTASRKELQRQSLFENSSLTAKQKEQLDRMLLAGEGEKPADYSGKDAFRITSELEEGQQKRAFRALDAGISAETYIGVRESFPENAKKADKIQAIFERTDLDAEQKAELEEIMLKNEDQENYYPADYTNEQTLKLSTHVRPGTDTHLSQKHREKAVAGAQVGIPEEMYLYAWDELGNMESSEVNGRSVGDVSYKKKAFIDALTQDSAQRQYLYGAFGVSKKVQSGARFILYGAGENPVDAYRNTLNITYGK